MTRAERWIDRWVALLNTPNPDEAASFLSPRVTIYAYEEGVDGPQKTYVGLDAVYKWISKAPQGRFLFERLSASIGDVQEALPNASERYTGGYRITHEESGFTNTGRWELAIEGDHIVGLLHLPEPIDD